jgi:hypothetical protein
MSCESACYEAQVNGCGNIILKAGLAASTAYYVQINKGNNSNVYQRQVVTDVDGVLTIIKADFPAGYFAPGYFNLKLRLANTYILQPMVFNAISYNCVLIQVINTDIETDDLSPISTIQ